MSRLKKYDDESYVHFITTVTARRQPYFQDPALCRIVADNIKFYQQKFNLEVYGWVIMPDHLHLVVWWDVEQQPELTVSKIVQGIKGASARQIVNFLKHKGGLDSALLPRREQRLSSTPRGGIQQEQRLSSTLLVGSSEPPLRAGSHRRGLRCQIWQPGFYDFNIYSEKKLQEKIDYLKNNVIRAGLADDWQDYPWIYLKYS